MDWVRKNVCIKKINQPIGFIAVCLTVLIAISTEAQADFQGIASTNSNQVEAEKLLAR